MNFSKVFHKIHYKCRNSAYPRSSVTRFAVPDDKVPWNVEWPEYNPVAYTSPAITNQPWADPIIGSASFHPVWNALDGNINRKSHHSSPYRVVNGYPLNPLGRTGVTGRGVLGRWGPNHAADPVLTRWKRNEDNSIDHDDDTGKPILQFVAIQRKDCKEWAIPGGMVDPGETVTATLKREFLEEAFNILAADAETRKAKVKLVEEFFTGGVELYKGYVDDPRNTDNAWMETVATNFHDEDGTHLSEIHLEAGDDAAKVNGPDEKFSLVMCSEAMNVMHITNCLKNLSPQGDSCGAGGVKTEICTRPHRATGLLPLVGAAHSSFVPERANDKQRKLGLCLVKMQGLKEVYSSKNLPKGAIGSGAHRKCHCPAVPPRNRIPFSRKVVFGVLLGVVPWLYPAWVITHLHESKN